jgi:hypothetical protein
VSTQSDRTQIGLSDEANDQLETVRLQGGFRNEQDVYRLAIAVAIAEDLAPTPEDLQRTNKYNIGGLDPDRALVTAVRYLRTDHADRPVAYMERLAEAGMQYMYAHVESGRSLHELLARFAPASREPD